MRLGILSDLHCELDGPQATPTLDGQLSGHPSKGPLLVELENAVDLLLIGGDTDLGVKSLAYASYAADYLKCPAVVIAGNHEFYGSCFPDMRRDLRDAAEGLPNVHFLENAVSVFDNGGQRIRVLGCALWTDYALYAAGNEDVDMAMQIAASRLADHKQISKPDSSRFTPTDALEEHRQSVEWLTETLAQPFDGETVVMTHHAVSERSIAPKHKGDLLSAAFASNLEGMVAASGANLWVHGHTHHDVDYMLGDTRVLSRQRGYPDEFSLPFAPAIVEV